MAPSRCCFDQTAVWHSDAARGPSTPSFNDLVGENIELRRNRKPEGVGGLAIDHQIEPGRLLDWPPCTFEIDRAIRGVTPALSACRRPLHRRLSESEKPTVSPQRSPETREQVGRLFRRCDLFDWRFFGSGFFAMFIGGVQEPIDQAGAALLHDPRGLGLLPILENFVISLVAHGILHLRSAPTVKQLRSIVHSSELTIVSQFLQRIKLEAGRRPHFAQTCRSPSNTKSGM